jgi:putative aldouronate transport system permease protein
MNNASSVAATIISQSDMTLLDSMTRVTETSLKFTITMVTVIPVMCVYPFVQKFYVKGVMIGAVKG